MRPCWVVLVASVLVAGGARAQDPSSVAREHYQRGTRAFELSQYDEAIAEYMAAYRAMDDPALLFNIAQAYRLADQPSEALKFYRSYLHKAPQAPNRTLVERRIEELQKLMEQRKALRDMPPDHVLTQPAPETTALPPPTPERSATQSPALVAKASAPADRPGHTKKVVGIAVAAVGVAAVAAGVVFGVAAKSASDELTKASQNFKPYDPNKDDAGHRDQLLEGVFIGVGAAAIATGALLFVLGQRENKTPASALNVRPSLSQQTAAISLCGSF